MGLYCTSCEPVLINCISNDENDKGDGLSIVPFAAQFAENAVHIYIYSGKSHALQEFTYIFVSYCRVGRLFLRK